MRYRLAWVQSGVCRVLFDNHHGKQDHQYVDGVESPYDFTTIHQLRLDFEREVRKLGGPL